MSEKPKRKWERRTEEFRQRALERMKTCKNVTLLARELGVAPQLLYIRKQQAEGRKKGANLARAGIRASGGYVSWRSRSGNN